MSVVVEAKEVYKNYGKVQALRGASLTVKEGQVYGLVGPNGAGKTTLLRILAGLAKPA
ncbi:MAG: ATP-binding cassette domain-containing protein, partial [Desulfurococcaceae archaeon]